MLGSTNLNIAAKNTIFHSLNCLFSIQYSCQKMNDSSRKVNFITNLTPIKMSIRDHLLAKEIAGKQNNYL